MTTRIFVSQPMTGYSDEAIEWVRSKIMESVPEMLDIYDPLEIPLIPAFQAACLSPVSCLGKSVKNMGFADLVIFAPGWKEARGCRVEHIICESYGLPFVELSKEDGGYVVSLDGRDI